MFVLRVPLFQANGEEEIDMAIEYVLRQCEDITPLALQKALYYIQGFYFAFYESFLFSEECEAWIHGSVYRDVYVRYKDYRFDPIKISNETERDEFTTTERAVLDNVIKHICCYSGKVLETFTHNEKPWRITRGNLEDHVPSGKNIQKEQIGNTFHILKMLIK